MSHGKVAVLILGVSASSVLVILVSTTGIAATGWLYGLFEQAISRGGYRLQNAWGFHHGTRSLDVCVLFGCEHRADLPERGEPLSWWDAVPQTVATVHLGHVIAPGAAGPPV